LSKHGIKEILDKTNEISLTVRGRKSGQDISRPVWFVVEGNSLYFLPVQGSDTNWYRNAIEHTAIKISVEGQELSGKAKMISDEEKVKEIVEKFKSKYGSSNMIKYYTKLDVTVEFSLKM
jgi:hypothetical protein